MGTSTERVIYKDVEFYVTYDWSRPEPTTLTHYWQGSFDITSIKHKDTEFYYIFSEEQLEEITDIIINKKD